MLVSASALMHRDMDGLCLGVSALIKSLIQEHAGSQRNFSSVDQKCVYLNTKQKKREREGKVPSDQCCFQKWLLGDSYRRAGQTYADVPWYGFWHWL